MDYRRQRSTGHTYNYRECNYIYIYVYIDHHTVLIGVFQVNFG